MNISNLTLLFFLFLFSCIAGVDRYNANGTEKDLKSLLDENGIQSEKINCSMFYSSRRFYCYLKVKNPDTLIQKFKLKKVSRESSKFLYHYTDESDSCESKESFQNAEIYETEGNRTKEIRFLENMIFFQNLNSEDSCILSSIAYG